MDDADGRSIVNCKQGDIAVIVESAAGNEGKIVRCMELLPDLISTDKSGGVKRGPGWTLDISLPDWAGGHSNEIHDSKLRPIRDNPGTDETLTWCDVPSKVTA